MLAIQIPTVSGFFSNSKVHPFKDIKSASHDGKEKPRQLPLLYLAF